MLRNKTILKIFSLLAAILLWVYVTGEVDPETRLLIRDIPVTLANTDQLAEKGLAVVWEEEIFINATVEGRRSDVNDVKKTGLTAYIDAAQFTKGKNTGKVSINAPESISVETVSKSTFRLKVEQRTEVQKPVEIEFVDVVSDTDKIPWILELDPQQISVSGAESAVERIASFRGVVSAEETSEEKSRRVSVEVIPVTEDGTRVLGVSPDHITVKAEIQLLLGKTLDLSITPKNIEKGLEVDKLDAARRIHVIGPADTLAGMDQITGTVDLAGITDMATVEILLALPENTFPADGNDGLSAEVTMKETVQETSGD